MSFDVPPVTPPFRLLEDSSDMARAATCEPASEQELVRGPSPEPAGPQRRLPLPTTVEVAEGPRPGMRELPAVTGSGLMLPGWGCPVQSVNRMRHTDRDVAGRPH